MKNRGAAKRQRTWGRTNVRDVDYEHSDDADGHNRGIARLGGILVCDLRVWSTQQRGLRARLRQFSIPAP